MKKLAYWIFVLIACVMLVELWMNFTDEGNLKRAALQFVTLLMSLLCAGKFSPHRK